jgi:uncharacterized damage-inducible protein DinB
VTANRRSSLLPAIGYLPIADLVIAVARRRPGEFASWSGRTPAGKSSPGSSLKGILMGRATFAASVLVGLLLTVRGARAQSDPVIASARAFYGDMKGVLLRAAEKMPEADYGFRPTASVRTYGQIIGHLADANELFCSIARGEKNPNRQVEQTISAKSALLAALRTAFADCDRAYERLSAASAAQVIDLFGTATPRLGVLTANNMHSAEHYGNLVVYLRLKGIVPPTSEPGSRVIALGAIVPPAQHVP